MSNYPLSKPILSTQTTTTISPKHPQNTDIVIILICLLCTLICSVGVLGLIRWTCQKRAITSSSMVVDVEVPSECLKKKKTEIVEGLPRMIFKEETDVVTLSADCVICLSEFFDGEVIRVLPVCNHVFHVGCIDTWLIASQSFCCPSCRQGLVVGFCQKSRADVSVTLPEPDFLP